MDYDEIKESLQRCRNIIYSSTFESFVKNLNNSICEQYPKEQCYEDILKCCIFNSYSVSDFIKYVLDSDDQKDIDIIMKNLNLVKPEYLLGIILELNKEPKWKETLKQTLRSGIVKTYNTSTASIILDVLLLEDDGAKLVVERFEDFFANGYDLDILTRMMERAKLPEQKILENRIKILNHSYGENIIKFVKWFREKGVYNDNDISLQNFVRNLHSDIKDEPSLKIIETLYKELMDKQGILITDIDILNPGEFCKVYKIGSFLLKIGDTRETKTIPYHRRILQPIVRQDTNPNNENNLYIEIQNVVDNNWYIGKSEEEIEEELYQIYKEMRKDGIVWTDLKKENVGRLIKPNRTNYYTETLVGDINDEKSLRVVETELEVNDEAVGIIERKQEDCLQSGDLVILDSDYIFKAEDIDLEEDLKLRTRPKYIKYELRYRYELEKQKEER